MMEKMTKEASERLAHKIMLLYKEKEKNIKWLFFSYGLATGMILAITGMLINLWLMTR